MKHFTVISAIYLISCYVLDIMGPNLRMTLEIERKPCLRCKRHETTPKRVPCWHTFIFSKYFDNFSLSLFFLYNFTQLDLGMTFSRDQHRI